MNNWNISPNAAALYRSALVLDMTVPMLQRSDLSLFFAALARMQASGYTFVSLTIAADHTGTVATLGNIALLRTMLLARARVAGIVRTVEDIREAKARGRLAFGLNFQGTMPVGKNLALIGLFYKLGIRHMLMAYNTKNYVGYGCHDAVDEGLTPFGRAVIKEMNRVGMLVDVGHTGCRTAMETIEVSQAPVIVSHGNVWSIHQHPRCYRDDLIKALAAKGGVFGVTGFGLFLGKNEASVDLYVRHIDHIVKLVGAKHVAIGSDYVYDMRALAAYIAAEADKFPEDGGYAQADIKQLEIEDTPRIGEALMKRGYSEEDIRGILGENWMRVFAQVWK